MAKPASGGRRHVGTGRPRESRIAVKAHETDAADHPLIFISAAEPSADRHGASLIRAVHDLSPEARFVGVAGPRMVEAGCESIFDITGHAGMLLGVFRVAGRAFRLWSTADAHLRRYPFDACVVIDSPMLHLPLIQKARAAGVPTLYYIAPQMWAWGTYRIHKLRDRVDHVAAILPFEEEFFRNQGVDATFVGHPLAEQLRAEPVDQAAVDDLRGKGKPFVALLPGSRSHVVEEVFPGQLEVARAVAARFPEATFGVSVASPKLGGIIEERIRVAGLSERVRPYPGRHRELIESADLVLVASGTTALEVAFCGTPMIVMYNASRLFYHLLARWMIHTRYLSLPNILAGREIVPEFMPYYRSTAPIAEAAIELLADDGKHRAMREALAELVGPLRNGNASARTAEILLRLAASRHH